MKGKMDKKEVERFLNKTPEELKKMGRVPVHEGYKKIMQCMLFQFYMDCSDHLDSVETIEDLQKYIYHWVENHTGPPNEDWKPGDRAK